MRMTRIVVGLALLATLAGCAASPRSWQTIDGPIAGARALASEQTRALPAGPVG